MRRVEFVLNTLHQHVDCMDLIFDCWNRLQLLQCLEYILDALQVRVRHWGYFDIHYELLEVRDVLLQGGGRHFAGLHHGVVFAAVEGQGGLFTV